MAFQKIEELFFQQHYSDLPHPIRMNGQNETPYDRQVFIVPKGENKWDIVKRIKFAEGTKVLRSSIRSMCTGRTLEIEYCKQCREGGRALQYRLGGASWGGGGATTNIYIHRHTYIHIYIYMCVCVCVCVGGWVGVGGCGCVRATAKSVSFKP